MTPIATLDELADGALRLVRVGDAALILCQTEEGEVSAFDALCPHAGVHLVVSEHAIDGAIICPLHGARFSAATGQGLGKQAHLCITRYQVRVVEEIVFLDDARIIVARSPFTISSPRRPRGEWV